jgi:molybdopterin-guanine dinucleotide biosynthesis protein B
MAIPRLISIIGRKNAGKTTLLVALAAAFVRRGLDVATLKHGHHPAAADQQGKDTWRHYHEGGARRVMIESPGGRVLFERTPSESDPFTLARRYLDGADIILLEGFKHFPIPKIEVHRQAIQQPPLAVTDPGLPGGWVALLTDQRDIRVSCSCFLFSDTSWLQMLATVALDKALPLDQAP